MADVAHRFRVLLDEGVPEALRHAFSARVEVATVRFCGFVGMRNGDLIRAAEPMFDVLVTVDKRLRYQQNIPARSIAVVVLDAGGTTVAHLRPLVASAEAAILGAAPGDVVVVTDPRAPTR